MDTFNPRLVNIFIEASSKEKLIALQVYTNTINSRAYNYQTPFKDGSKWIVWFFADYENHIYTSEKDLGDLIAEKKKTVDNPRGEING